jgi:hypothetical protein
MQLFCPTCGTPISADDIKIDRAVGTCRVCKSVTSVDQFGSKAEVTGAPSSPKGRNRPEIPRPNHFSVEDDGSSLRISFRWIWHRFKGAAAMCFVWNCFVAGCFWMVLRACPLILLVLVFSIPSVGIGLLLVYATLAGFLNRTVIKVTSESLTIRHGPVPWWGNRSLPIDRLERLYCKKDTADSEDAGECTYCVNALTNRGDKVDLVEDLHDLAEALFIKHEIERWLKIDDGGVRESKPVSLARHSISTDKG